MQTESYFAHTATCPGRAQLARHPLGALGGGVHALWLYERCHGGEGLRRC
jgi:hypothetical protein